MAKKAVKVVKPNLEKKVDLLYEYLKYQVDLLNKGCDAFKSYPKEE